MREYQTDAQIYEQADMKLYHNPVNKINPHIFSEMYDSYFFQF